MKELVLNEDTGCSVKRLPSWLKKAVPDKNKIRDMLELLQTADLNTVCQGSHCPNIGTCWGQGVATFMILGKVCTRSCRFCAILSGDPSAVDDNEPFRVAQVIKKLDLKYVVITSVTRDDLADRGSHQFSQTTQCVRKTCPETKIELLIPDFMNERQNIERVVLARPDVLSHNLEMVERLSAQLRPQSSYERSLDVLRSIKQKSSSLITKSSLMVGLGEKDDEIKKAMDDLVGVGCDILTIGQYLAPSRGPRHFSVQEYIQPEKFKEYETWGFEIGFKSVISGPFVRSSYLAEQGYLLAQQSFDELKEK